MVSVLNIKNKKAEVGGLPINTVIIAIIALIVVLIAVWLGSKTVGIGKFVSDALI